MPKSARILAPDNPSKHAEMSRSFPRFADLPFQKDGPHGNAWGVWGSDDQVGTLNHVTQDTVAKAANECIQTGKVISLKYVG